MNDAEKELEDLERADKGGYTNLDKEMSQYLIHLAEKRFEKEQEHVHTVRVHNSTVINKFLRIVSELKKLYSFFERGHANALVDGEQSVINDALKGLERKTGFARFLKNNKNFKKGDWF